MKKLFALVVLLSQSSAFAGGFVLPVRGVRTVARGGAFVAGAEDADALWQNPAGLAHGAGNRKRSLLFDAAFVFQSVEHERIDSTGMLQPRVTNQQPGQAIPSLAGSLGIGDRLVIAGGLTAPYAAPHRYAADGPQRYASIDFGANAFVLVTIGAAYAFSGRLRVGATVQNLFSRVASTVALSACPDLASCGAEDPAYDAIAKIDQIDYIAPSGSIGLQYDVMTRFDHRDPRVLTVGLALQAPMTVSATGTFDVELPTSATFMDARVTGDQGALSFTLPPALRAGLELRPDARLRVEVAVDVELWGFHDEVTLAPKNIRFENVPIAGTYTLRTMTIPRDWSTSFSPSLGVEWHGRVPGGALEGGPAAPYGPKLMFGAGYAYETAAVPRGEVSITSVDASKHVVGIGGGYEDDGWQIGAAFALAQLADVDVASSEARVPPLTPLRDPTGAVNAGSYRSRYLVAGLRFARRW